MKGFFITISPKIFVPEHGEKLKIFLKKFCKDYVMVHECSDSGHNHWHLNLVLHDAATTSSVGQKLKRFWSKHDPDCCSRTIQSKRLFQDGNLEDPDSEGYTSAFQYIEKDPVGVWWMNAKWDIKTYHDDLWEHIPLAERRANVKWRLFATLDDLCKKHDVEVGASVFDCRVAMNRLSWVHKVYECPLDPRKFKQVAIGWWKYRTSYSGDCAEDPDDKPIYCESCKGNCNTNGVTHREQFENIANDLKRKLGM